MSSRTTGLIRTLYTMSSKFWYWINTKVKSYGRFENASRLKNGHILMKYLCWYKQYFWEINTDPKMNLLNQSIDAKSHKGLDTSKPVFGGLQATEVQTSLRILAVWSVHLMFAHWKVSYLDLLCAKFQFSS